MSLTAEQAVKRDFRVDYDRIYLALPDRVDRQMTELAAERALDLARQDAPRMSGQSANRLRAVWGDDYFGVRWIDRHVWFQEMGIKPFTMNHLAGKLIPMWVEDDDHSLRAKNPKIKSRMTDDGREQVLIFRKAANHGERKTVTRIQGGMEQTVSVPRSYPGAPGRINRRNKAGSSGRGRLGGQIAKTNVGVRWRHPGLSSRHFIHRGVAMAADEMGFHGNILVAAVGESLD